MQQRADQKKICSVAGGEGKMIVEASLYHLVKEQ
jgi:hypothetical protein